MSDARPHKRLEVWQKGLLLVRSVYEMSRSWPDEERFGLTSQARRAAVSVTANIAEGAARQTGKECLNFLHIAQGSLSELDTHLEIAASLGYSTSQDAGRLLRTVGRLLSGLIRSVRANGARLARKSRAAAMLLLLTVHCSLFTGGGCSAKSSGKSTLAVYQEALGEGTREGIERLKEDFRRERPLGFEEPVVPVMNPPETMLVWFANQKIGDEIFVHGHWVQIVIRPWEWNPEILNNPSSPSDPGGHGPPFPLHPESKPAPEGR